MSSLPRSSLAKLAQKCTPRSLAATQSRSVRITKKHDNKPLHHSISSLAPHRSHTGFRSNLCKPTCLPHNYRHFSDLPKDATHSGVRVSHVVGVLLVFGLGVTAWGLYDIYTSLTLWPKEIRDDLRMGLRAKYRGDLKLSQRYLARAWTTLLTLPTSSLSPRPYLKSSGLLITLAEVFEQDNQPLKAYWMYALAVKCASRDIRVPQELLVEASKCLVPAEEQAEAMDAKEGVKERKSEEKENVVRLPSETPLTSEGRLRLVSLALKLGDMAEQLKRPITEEYFWLDLAASHIGKVVTDQIVTSSDKSAETRTSSGKEGAHDTDKGLDLSLPSWTRFDRAKNGKVSVETLAAPYERIGAFYARVGDVHQALANYHYATVLLDRLGEKDDASKIVNSCRTAQIHNNSAETLIRHYEFVQENTDSSSPSSSSTSTSTDPSTSTSSSNPSDPHNVLTSAFHFATSAYSTARSCVDVSKTTGKSASQGGTNMDTETWGLCADVLPVAAYNLGIICELQGDVGKARAFFQTSLKFASAFSFEEGIREARAALRRMERQSRKGS